MKPLSQEERARISDGKHSIQAASDVLSAVDRSKIPNIDELEECLEKADQSLHRALQSPQQHTDRN